MASPKRIAQSLLASIDDKNAKAKESALYEIKELRNDLAVLEKILNGKQQQGDFSPMNVVHGAFEIYRHTASIFENAALSRDMETTLEQTMIRSELEKLGATLLKKPEGWHWISPQGEMHKLADAGQEEKALGKLKDLKSPRRKKTAAKKTAVKTEPVGIEQPANKVT